MSLQQPTRRVAVLATSTLSRTPYLPRALPLHPHPITLQPALPSTARTKFSLANLNPFRRRSEKKPRDAASDLDDPALRQRLQEETSTPKLDSSIFADEVQAAEARDLVSTKDQQQIIRPQHLAPTADPDPQSRQRWERKMVMRMVAREGHETRTEIIRRTEREMRYKSEFMATSIKKLMHLARQIQGMTVDEALVQMRYSKKKMAREIRHHLELARDRAVVEHGMGLGEVNGEAPLKTPRSMLDREGKWRTVTDPSRIYIAQAWVGKGPWRGRRLVSLGRGRKGMHMKPSTSISFILKEERTRIREHDEKVAKEKKQGPWIHLPNRPVTAQRQYYQW